MSRKESRGWKDVQIGCFTKLMMKLMMSESTELRVALEAILCVYDVVWRVVRSVKEGVWDLEYMSCECNRSIGIAPRFQDLIPTAFRTNFFQTLSISFLLFKVADRMVFKYLFLRIRLAVCYS